MYVCMYVCVVFANGLGDCYNPRLTHIKTQKMLLCVTLSIIRYGSKIKWSNPRKWVAPSPNEKEVFGPSSHWLFNKFLENSVRYCCTSYEMMGQFYDFRFKWTATAAIGIHPTKAWLSQLVNFKNAIWTWGRTICNKIVLNLEKMPQKPMECFRLLFDRLAWIEHQFLSGIRDSRKAGSLWGIMRGVGGVRKSIHQSW